MSTEVEQLKNVIETQKQKIQDQEKELERLQDALRKANENGATNAVLDRPIKQEEDGDVTMVDDRSDEDAEDDEEMIPLVELEPDVVGQPMWLEGDRIYRCSVCDWEIVERRCENCNRDYQEWVCEETPDSLPIDTNLLDDVYQKRQQEVYRMSGPPRDTTPLQDVDPARLHPETVAYDYEDRVEEYQALLTRGATRMMCETFYLDYSRDTGIWLEMKDDLLYEWAGPTMLQAGLNSDSEDPRDLEPAPGKFVSWKVCLGREIVLDREDRDGSRYVDEFLEEALLFGCHTGGTLAWRTIEETPGSGKWITIPFVDEPSKPNPRAGDFREYLGYLADWEEITQVARNEYESDNSGDEDEQCILRQNEDGMAQLGWDGEGGYGPVGFSFDDEEADGEASDEDKEEDEDETMSDPGPPSEADSFDSDWDSDDPDT